MERALSHADNVYQIPNARFTGRVCRTNLASNTAFRGFGGPQGMMITEQMMEHVATALKLDPYKASRGALCWLANIVMEAVCVPIL